LGSQAVVLSSSRLRVTTTEGEAQLTTSAASSVLRLVSVTKSFAGVQALKDVSFEVLPNSIVGLIGPNGAGKTTLFNCVTGFLPPDHGAIYLGDRRIDGLRPHRIARLGIVRTFQAIRMLPGFTVLESLIAAMHQRTSRTPLRLIADPKYRSEVLREAVLQADEIIAELGLEEARERPCDQLTFLDQRKVEVARAMAARPSMLLLDEPSAGATDAEAEALMHVVDSLRARGMAILLIEHNVPFVMGLADRLVVLNFGEVVSTGVAAQVRQEPILREIYLGA